MAVTSKFADRQFWIDTGDRAFATFAQTFVSGGILESSGVLALDLKAQLSLAGGAALVAIGTSIGFRGKNKETE